MEVRVQPLVVITGAGGFIGQNLAWRLRESGYLNIVGVTRQTPTADIHQALRRAEFVFHLAGVNRPQHVEGFRENADFTELVCHLLADSGLAAPIVLTSSSQAALENPYGASKRDAENAVIRYGERTGAPTYVLRLPNVFGKWSRPNYNSAVATFCHSVGAGIPIVVNDPRAALTLVYVDDVVAAMLRLLGNRPAPGRIEVTPTYATTVGDVASLIESFPSSRQTLIVPPVGGGLTRALYATYLSFLRPPVFAYPLERHADPRGVFVEFLKTRDSGQLSFFTAPPGITRGEHYHHTKNEKFLVVRGRARFGFRHVVTNERFDLEVSEEAPQVVETVPGWVHSVTNIGEIEMVVMLWANEIFDREAPDTIVAKVTS